MKSYADKNRKAAAHKIKIGQLVLITNTTKHRNKYTPRWLPTPGVVTGVKGNGIFLEHNNKSLSEVKLQF